MILYDTPGVIEKKMHKLDSMMMKNVRNAAVNADCVLVLVDASKVPQKVRFSIFNFDCGLYLSCPDLLCVIVGRLMKSWRKV